MAGAEQTRDALLDLGPTRYDRAAVEALGDERLAWHAKGWPMEPPDVALRDVGAQGWRLLGDDLAFPVLTLREDHVAHNIAVMAEYAAGHEALLAPHAKTTMAPQLFARQIDAGCWALTCATPAHLRVYRRFGVQRILYANELVERSAIAWVAEELRRDPAFELLVLADSVEGVERLDAGLAGAPRRVGVLIEVGYPGGRGGCRSPEEALAVAAAVERSPRLALAGVEAFEGLIHGDSEEATVAAVDAFLETLTDVVDALVERDDLAAGTLLVSAGGSAYFDRAVATLADRDDTQLVLRSGAYVVHDDGLYAGSSALAGRRGGPSSLRSALEVWGVVLSVPEPGFAVVGFGKRDAPADNGLPVPLHAGSEEHGLRDIAGRARVERLSDQHAHVRFEPGVELRLGEVVGCGISHPCLAFDRWRCLPVIGAGHEVTGAVVTFF